MNRAEMDFYQQASDKTKKEATEQLNKLIDDKLPNNAVRSIVLDFIMENKFELRSLIPRIIG